MQTIYKYLMLVLAIATATTNTTAQNTIQIGTAPNFAATTFYGPFYRFSATSTTTHARSCMLYTQEEITNLGMPAGATITKVEFYKATVATMILPSFHAMYMANTNDTALVNTTTWASILASHTKIYSDSNFIMHKSADWVIWPLNTPFVYTGGALSIATDQVMPGNGAADGIIRWQYTIGTPTNKIIGQTGNTPPPVLNGTNANYLQRPNIRITYTPPPLPVTLVSFTATQNAGKAILNWQMAGENAIGTYTLERSINGIHFIELGKGINTSPGKYNYTDDESANLFSTQTKLFYRFYWINSNGSKQYSPVIHLAENTTKKITVSLYPNPSKSLVYCVVQTPVTTNVQYKLYNIEGKCLKQSKTTILAPGQSNVPISGAEYLSNGIYTVQLIFNNNVHTLKWVKQ